MTQVLFLSKKTKLYVSLPEIGDYTVPEIFDNKKIRTSEKCSKSLASAGLAIFIWTMDPKVISGEG